MCQNITLKTDADFLSGGNVKLTALIPARLDSSRFPGKALCEVKEKPLVLYAVDAAKECAYIDDVYVLTDHSRIRECVAPFCKVIMTEGSFCNGSERCASVLDDVDCDYICNIQADQLVTADYLNSFIARINRFYDFHPDIVHTPVYRLTDERDFDNPNIVKAVYSRTLRKIIYFSRSPVPWNGVYLGHTGIYIYHRSVLELYRFFKRSEIEGLENLEQLRILESTNHTIRGVEMRTHPVSIDSPDDLKRINHD